MRPLFYSIAIILISLAYAAQAHADYYVWKDSGTGVSLSYPDTWKMVSNADPDDVVTIMPPSGRAHAACRVRVRADARYSFYPEAYSWAIQPIAYSRDFWGKYLAEYDDSEIYMVRDGAGFGRGFASYALAEYDSAVQGPYMKRRALMFVSLYHDKAYILECSAHAEAFADWKKAFLSIAKSVNFQQISNGLTVGNYRDFLADPRIEFDGDEGENRVIY